MRASRKLGGNVGWPFKLAFETLYEPSLAARQGRVPPRPATRGERPSASYRDAEQTTPIGCVRNASSGAMAPLLQAIFDQIVPAVEGPGALLSAAGD